MNFQLIIIKYVCIPFFCCSKSVKKSESDVFGSSRLLTAGELRRQREVKRRQERKRGYCECCHVKYEDLDKVNFCLKTSGANLKNILFPLDRPGFTGMGRSVRFFFELLNLDTH